MTAVEPARMAMLRELAELEYRVARAGMARSEAVAVAQSKGLPLKRPLTTTVRRPAMTTVPRTKAKATTPSSASASPGVSLDIRRSIAAQAQSNKRRTGRLVAAGISSGKLILVANACRGSG